MKNLPQEHYTPIQLKIPVEIEKKIKISDLVYSFSEVLRHIDLNKYLTVEERRIGRPRYDEAELEEKLGYEKSERVSEKAEQGVSKNYRNGYSKKTVKT